MSAVGQLLVGGVLTTGDSICRKNGRTIYSVHLSFLVLIFTVMAALAISNIVMTSLGPVGLEIMWRCVCSTNEKYSLNYCACRLWTCIMFICIGITLNLSLSCFMW